MSTDGQMNQNNMINESPDDFSLFDKENSA